LFPVWEHPLSINTRPLPLLMAYKRYSVSSITSMKGRSRGLAYSVEYDNGGLPEGLQTCMRQYRPEQGAYAA
jgi:hypothetical protein